MQGRFSRSVCNQIRRMACRIREKRTEKITLAGMEMVAVWWLNRYESSCFSMETWRTGTGNADQSKHGWGSVRPQHGRIIKRCFPPIISSGEKPCPRGTCRYHPGQERYGVIEMTGMWNRLPSRKRRNELTRSVRYQKCTHGKSRLNFWTFSFPFASDSGLPHFNPVVWIVPYLFA